MQNFSLYLPSLSYPVLILNELVKMVFCQAPVLLTQIQFSLWSRSLPDEKVKDTRFLSVSRVFAFNNDRIGCCDES